MMLNRIDPAGVCVALTGGIACGKSEAARVLEGEGALVWDADVAAHQCLEPGAPAYQEVVGRFGPGILRLEGGVDRAALGRRVFASPQDRKDLESIVHPAVIQALQAWREMVHGRPAVAVIPLLFEAGLQDSWTAVVAIGAGRSVVLERLRGRGLSLQESEQRLAAQWPVEKKMEGADYAVWNQGSLEAFQENIRAVWKEILNKKENTYHG